MQNTTKIEIIGRIDYDNDEGRRIFIISDTGERINLVDAFENATDRHGKNVSVNYWISNEPRTREQSLEGLLKKLYGFVEIDCDYVFQGSLTFTNASSVGYDKNYSLQVGGHDLLDELVDCDGKYIIIELEFNTK